MHVPVLKVLPCEGFTAPAGEATSASAPAARQVTRNFFISAPLWAMARGPCHRSPYPRRTGCNRNSQQDGRMSHPVRHGCANPVDPSRALAPEKASRATGFARRGARPWPRAGGSSIDASPPGSGATSTSCSGTRCRWSRRPASSRFVRTSKVGWHAAELRRPRQVSTDRPVLVRWPRDRSAVAAVFEISDGRIRAWREYFDMSPFLGARTAGMAQRTFACLTVGNAERDVIELYGPPRQWSMRWWSGWKPWSRPHSMACDRPLTPIFRYAERT